MTVDDSTLSLAELESRTYSNAQTKRATSTPLLEAFPFQAEPGALNPQHQTLLHALSLSGLDAAGSATVRNDPLFNNLHLKPGAHPNEQTATVQQVLHLLASELRDRDAKYQTAMEHLNNERKQRHLFAEERNTAREELELLKSANHNQEDLQARVDRVSHQLAEKCSHVDDAEKRLREAVEDGEQRVTEVTNRLSLDNAKVSETLQQSSLELNSLRKRCRELENELTMEKSFSSSPQSESSESVQNSPSSPSSAEVFPKSVMKKMFELKIARAVISEKDKILKELRDDVKRAETRASDSEMTKQSTESRAADLEKELAGVKKELSSARDDASLRQILLQDAEEKLETMESEIKKAKKDTADALVVTNESEEKRREYKELMESTARRCNEALAEKQASMKQSEKLQESLTAAEQEIARLGDILQRESKNNGEYLGSTSPCSLVTDVDANAQSVSSPLQSRRVQSLAELEEAASGVSPKPTSAKWEVKQLERPSPEEESTVESLSKPLPASCPYCDEKNEQLQEALATIDCQGKALKRINSELDSRKEECKVFENQVGEELTPALHATNESLEERERQLKLVQEEYGLRQEMAEKTRCALELEVGRTAGRLQDALASLQDTHNELSKSQQRASDLEDQLANLKRQRTETQENLGELEQANDHMRQSLLVMQERLTAIESCVAGQEQTVTDTLEEKEHLENVLSKEVDRREVAEKRATRKDGLVLQLEARTLELERNHAALKEHLKEKTEHMSNIEEGLNRTKEIARLRDDALQEQATMCQRREAVFESLTEELRMVIQSRNSELTETKENLSNVERRLRSLAKCLEEERSKVRSSDCELAEIRRKFGDSEAENRRKAVKLSGVEDQCSRLTAEHQAAQEELKSREQQIASQLTSISEKAGKIASHRAEKTELEKTIRELRSVLDVERIERKSQVATTKKLEEDLAAVRTNFAACKHDLSLRDTEIESLSRILTSAQNEFLRMKDVVADKDEEISAGSNTISKLEKTLEQSKHQLAMLESHLDGHDTLLKDNRDKEESLAVKSGELNQAREVISKLEEEVNGTREKVTSKKEEIESLLRKVVALEAAKTSVEKELERTKKARRAVEKSLNETSASLAALEKSTTEEIADLNATVASLKKVIDEKDSSLNSASETIAQSSVQSNLTKEQLIDSRTRGDRLFSRLTATEYELASKKSSLETMELRFREIQEALNGREEELGTLKRTLVLTDQELSSARSKIDEMSKQACASAAGELLAMQTKLEAKENAIANLHNWCCFINGKLHAVEKALSERDVDLEVSSTAFKKLESQLRNQNELLSEKESQMRKLASSRVVENSELRSRIHSLQSHVDEAKSELVRTKQMMSSEGSKTHSAHVAVSEELIECKANLKSLEKEMSEVLSRHRNLEETMKTYERDLAASEKTIEYLTLDLGRTQIESSRKWDAKDANDRNAAEEILKVRSESGYLIAELRKAEAGIAAANETAKTWQQKAEELQPLAESTLEAQRAVEIVSSQLALLQKDTKQRTDLLETQLKDAERARDAAERDCSAAIADYTAMRARLMEVHSRGMAYTRLAAANTLATVTFVLTGRNAPYADVMVYILGEDATLGEWNPSRRLPVRVIGEGENGIIRKCEVVLPANLSTAYKYAADGPDGALVWEGDENRSLDLQGDATREVTDVWRSPR